MEKLYRYTVAGHTFGIEMPAQLEEDIVLKPYLPFKVEDCPESGMTSDGSAAGAVTELLFKLKVQFVDKAGSLPVGRKIECFNDDAPFMWLFEAGEPNTAAVKINPLGKYVFGFSNNRSHSDCFLFTSPDAKEATVCLPSGLLKMFEEATPEELEALRNTGRGTRPGIQNGTRPGIQNGNQPGSLNGGQLGNQPGSQSGYLGTVDPKSVRKNDDVCPSIGGHHGHVLKYDPDADDAEVLRANAASGNVAAETISRAEQAQHMLEFVLTNCMMLLFTTTTAPYDTLMIHASVVRHKGKGYIFLGKSGTGKSTHSSLWLKYIDHIELMNDDNPVIRMVDGVATVFGTPWSGKTPCYKNIQAPIGGIVRLTQAPENKIERLNVLNAFAALMPSCSCMKWDHDAVSNLHKTLEKVVSTTPIYGLGCRPDEEAARVCYNGIVK